jgi:hypothetical protein
MSAICRLCGTNARLVDSHIIPRAFFNIEHDQPAKMLSNSRGSWPRRAPIGVYDQIVCESCERSFSIYDQYAAETLLQGRRTIKTIYFKGRPLAYLIADIDYRLLKLFAIAVVWRASVARHHFYARVSLGPLEDLARQMLLAGNPGTADTFGVWWSRFDMDWEPGVMDPFCERWGENRIRAYRFYLGRAIAYIKCDARPIPREFRDIALQPGVVLPLIARDFQRSTDRRAMLAVVNAHLRG